MNFSLFIIKHREVRRIMIINIKITKKNVSKQVDFQEKKTFRSVNLGKSKSISVSIMLDASALEICFVVKGLSSSVIWIVVRSYDNIGFFVVHFMAALT